MRSSGRLWAARQLLTIVRARRRSFRELVGSTNVAPAAPTWVREYSGRVRTVGTVAEPDGAPAAAGAFALARSSVLGLSRHLLRPRQLRLAGSPGGEPHALIATTVPPCPPGTTTFRPQPLRILSPTRHLPWSHRPATIKATSRPTWNGAPATTGFRSRGLERETTRSCESGTGVKSDLLRLVRGTVQPHRERRRHGRRPLDRVQAARPRRPLPRARTSATSGQRDRPAGRILLRQRRWRSRSVAEDVHRQRGVRDGWCFAIRPSRNPAAHQMAPIRRSKPDNAGLPDRLSGSSSRSTSRPGRYTNTCRFTGSISHPSAAPLAT